MPELPEAEIARRQLDRWLGGRPLTFSVLDAAVVRHTLSSKPSDAVDDPEAALSGLGAPGEVIRHGKRIGWSFADGKGLLVHLGMSGKFVKRPASEEPPKFARLGMIGGDVAVWFLDRRRFGCVTPIDGGLDAAIREGHGPDALDEAPDGPGLKAILTGRRAIKVALMDQAKLAGVGNIQAVEALHRAAIDPRTPCSKLSDPQWAALARAIPEQLQYVIDAEDAGEITYVTEDPAANPFVVYKREGEACTRCGGTIQVIKQSGRSTFWCAGCQA